MWDALDAWYDEAERVEGHLRDPFHRVNVREASAGLHVWHGGRLLAESSRAKVLSESGMPNRYYVPREDVEVDLKATETTTMCPYKGAASYWSVAGCPTQRGPTRVLWMMRSGWRDTSGFDHDDVVVGAGRD